MVFVRKNVWAAGGDFSDPLLFWYAKGVNSLIQRAIDDPTSWRFLAAIHGIDISLWRRYGYLNNHDSLPPQSLQNIYWNQCQHQTWYFLPWHRGYLASLEAIVRDAIIRAGGPVDWALPYWNYSDTTNPNARRLPPAFVRQTMPDGSPNPLFVRQRYGQIANPPSLPLPANHVLLGALNIASFKGQANGGSPGFGGIETGFSHFGGVNGRLESSPHNIIHVDIGSRRNQNTPGLMTDPDTAALDPIFWLHHCNIDRLWEVWLNRDPQHRNPTEALWLEGPIDRKFVVPLANGQDWKFAPKHVTQTTAPNLNYVYDDIRDPLRGMIASTARLNRLGASPSPRSATDRPMQNQPHPELIGANRNAIAVTGASISTQVRLDNRMIGKVARSFAAFSTAESQIAEPDRVFLNLENIRSNKDGAVIEVYVNVPGVDRTQHPDVHVGTIALFGARQASLADQPHGGQGVTEVLDITHVVDTLYLAGNLNTLSNLEVRFLPRSGLTQEDNVTVERVSIYRQNS